MDDNHDTDTLLALVSSLLIIAPPDAVVMLDALIECNGDVAATAQLLNQAANSRKRKRTNLDSWLLKSPNQKPVKIPTDSEHSKSDKDTAVPSSSRASMNSQTMDLMPILRAPPSKKNTALPQLPPLLLSNPNLVAQNTPCTLHLSVLPPKLACRLFYAMLRASEGWQRNKWWLFDRLVESPHRTAFFARKDDGVDSNESWQQAAQFWYNGRMTEAPDQFPTAMEEACIIVESIVNQELKHRNRFPLEWAGDDVDQTWRANVAASNCYEGSKEAVGFHSDQMTYLGPYPTIASLSLGTERIFRLREVIPTDQLGVRRARTFNIPLPHNSLTIMHASCQEGFKHSVPPQRAIDLYRPAFPEHPGAEIQASNCRINITFRFYRPDFRPPTIPRCKCGIPTVLRADMKNRGDARTDRYWWSCYAGAQNEGKGCNYWKLLDMKAEGRGPCLCDKQQA
ncbi:Alpha-ketoglutarate-dependent dioxygenase alkB 3 [Hypsizygus marmoreus]|uniref:Alpha-ketoglutarate-dependent dioxygenase alkB 3 n=1 Tax=Hypsizygus marmoreus TaxID=39966 RepID=A0A369JNP5_HYPMA|nr:Alpha-ketoglutarate-dependent dioxygenase alkB 3 [Hypsizygus marmoreus]